MPSHRVARRGDPLDHGGTIIEGSPKLSSEGKPVARVGDKAMCAQHGLVTITTGAAKFRVDGRACARVTSLTSCGARITEGAPKFTCD